MRGSRKRYRGVAQLGRALLSGSRGRRFESCLPDQFDGPNAHKQKPRNAGLLFVRHSNTRFAECSLRDGSGIEIGDENRRFVLLLHRDASGAFEGQCAYRLRRRLLNHG